MSLLRALVSQVTDVGTPDVVFTHNLGDFPKLGILWATRKGTSTGIDLTDEMSISYGMTDGTRQGSVSTGSRNGAGEARAVIYQNCTLGIAQNAASGFAGYPSKVLVFSAWTSTTATFTQIDPYGVGEEWTVHALFLGGSDLANVYVGTNQHETTATNSTFSVAEPTFTPHALILAGAGMVVNGIDTANDGGGAGSQTHLAITLGVTDGTNHATLCAAGNNSAGSSTETLFRTDRILQHGLGGEVGTTTQRNALQYVSFDTNGFTVRRFEESDTSYQNYFVYAALRMSNAAYVKVGTFTALNSVATFDVTTTGMDPKAIIAFGNGKNTAGSSTYGAEANFSFGMAANANQATGGIVADDASTAATWRATSALLRNYANATTHALVGEIASSSFGAEKFTLSQTDADPGVPIYGYIAFGEAPAGGGGGGFQAAWARNSNTVINATRAA